MSRPYVVVPALNPTQDGRADRDTLDRYATRAAASWVDALLLSGSTTRGDLLSVTQRADLIDLWLRYLPPHRLIACCWCPEDISAANERGVAAMMVMRDLPDRRAALDLLAALPSGSFIYSHPMYTTAVFDAALAEEAAAAGVTPAGGKIAKVSVAEVTAIHAAAGPGFALWDGSSRHIAASLDAGAAGVIATPLSSFPEPFPSSDVQSLQPAVDAVQTALDALPGRPERTALLTSLAFGQAPVEL